jgi:hypothetical protein
MGLNKKANALQDLEIAVNSHRFCFYSDFSLDREFKGIEYFFNLVVIHY